MAQLAASMLQGEERTVNVCCVPGSSAASGFALAARVWEPPAADGDELRRVLMWPGKLDNAAVFDQLGAKLAAAGFSCVAVDPPGCGMSAHRKSCDYYNDYDESLLMIEVADTIWGNDSRFIALGHASGGAIAATAAGAFPHRTIGLVCCESTLGLAGTDCADTIAPGFSRLNDTYRADKLRRRSAPLQLQDLDAASAAAILPAPASAQTAAALLRRQFRREHPDGPWLRTVDPRLVLLADSGAQCVVADEELCLALLKAVECPLQLLSSKAFATTEQEASADGWLALVHARRSGLQEGLDPSLCEEHTELDGGYYFLSDAADATAELITPFLRKAVAEAEAADAAAEAPPAAERRFGPPARGPPDAAKLAKEAARSEKGRLEFEAQGGLPSGRDAGYAVDVVAYDGSLRIACRHWPARLAATSSAGGTADGSGSSSSSSQGKRIFCYSGWLDNTGSYATLAPLFANAGYDVIAMDAPGSGLSAHLPPEAWYRTEHEAVLIMEVADAVGWGEDTGGFTLLAHSRGTSVSLIAACAFPERVDHVVLVESRLGYNFGEPDQAGAQMRAAYTTDLRNRTRKIRSFTDLEEAVSFSYNDPTFPKSYATSHAITVSKVRPRGDGALVFTHDMRTYGQAAPLYAQESVTREALAMLDAPLLLIQAANGFHAPRAEDKGPKGGDAAVETKLSPMQKQMRERMGEKEWTAMQGRMKKMEDDFQERRKIVPRLTEGLVPGQHHCHSDSPDETAAMVLDWLAAEPAAAAPHPPRSAAGAVGTGSKL